MTRTPIADRILRPTASRPFTSSSSTGRLDCAGGTVHRALAEAPIGGHGMLEAALAWQLLRQAGHGNTGEGTHAAVSRHLPVVETSSEAVAARIARLLSGLAWAIVTRADAGDAVPTRPPAVRVEVPRELHRKVLRALGNAWRDARRQFDPSVPGVAIDGNAAIALWRMGILVAGFGPSHNMIYLNTGTSTMAEMMAAAAKRLGLTPIVDNVHDAPGVALYHPGEVHWLLTEAGARGSATAWARGGRAAGAAR